MSEFDDAFNKGKKDYEEGNGRERGTESENIAQRCGWDYAKAQDELKQLQELIKGTKDGKE